VFSRNDIVATDHGQRLPCALPHSVKFVQDANRNLVVVANNCRRTRIHVEDRSYRVAPAFSN